MGNKYLEKTHVMNNHMFVLLNSQIYNRSREYDPTREMITGIHEYKE